MLEIYLPHRAEGFEFCYPTNDDDFETINRLLDGSPRHATWKAIEMHLIHADQGRPTRMSDAPWLGSSHALIFRPRVVDGIGKYLQQYGEILPVLCAEANLSLFNVTCVLEALDQANSTMKRFSSGKIMLISRYAFLADVIGDNDIFKIAGLRPTFVTTKFVQIWKNSGFEGLEFERVWSD